MTLSKDEWIKLGFAYLVGEWCLTEANRVVIDRKNHAISLDNVEGDSRAVRDGLTEIFIHAAALPGATVTVDDGNQQDTCRVKLEFSPEDFETFLEIMEGNFRDVNDNMLYINEKKKVSSLDGLTRAMFVEMGFNLD